MYSLDMKFTSITTKLLLFMEDIPIILKVTNRIAFHATHLLLAFIGFLHAVKINVRMRDCLCPHSDFSLHEPKRVFTFWDHG